MTVQQELSRFTGTQQWYKHWLGFLYTDGVKYMADTYGAYWLIDAVCSWQPEIKERKGEVPFQVWRLEVDAQKSTAVLHADDGNGVTIAEQEISYTDFPGPVELFLVDNVILVPSEY